MKKFYFVVSEEIDGRRGAYVEGVAYGANICGRWTASRFEIVHPCNTKKEAERIADEWNKGYKKSGIYLFD